MKLVDKPLTERQKTFANLYVLHAGSVSRTKIAIEAGYPERSAYQKAHELLNEEICPHVVKYIRELEKDVLKEFDLNEQSHLKELYEIREMAKRKGHLGVAYNAEVARGKVRQLYIDKIANLNVNEKEYREFLRQKNMSLEELEATAEQLVDNHLRIEKAKEVTYDEKKHKKADD